MCTILIVIMGIVVLNHIIKADPSASKVRPGVYAVAFGIIAIATLPSGPWWLGTWALAALVALALSGPFWLPRLRQAMK